MIYNSDKASKNKEESYFLFYGCKQPRGSMERASP